MNCKNCKKHLEPIDIFPNGLCQSCYEKIMDKIPIEKLDKPDFIKAIGHKRIKI